MRKPLIAGNWKMNKTLVEARALVSGVIERLDESADVDVLMCPPVQLLFPMAKAVVGSKIMLGAQNVHEEQSGAFTGEVSVAMLKDTGCSHILVGHSERRHIFGETGDRLAKKVRAVVQGGLTAIYCIGETLEDREAGRTMAVIDQQIDEVLSNDIPANQLIVAYEPVWAIGTGKTASPGQAQEVHAHIRSRLVDVYDAGKAEKLRILYGGSVKPGNAASILAQPDIDGALVGGACLVVEDFAAIISAVLTAA